MTDKQQNLCRLAALLLMATSLSGCNTWSRLTSIGKEPELAPIQNPVDAPGYQAVSMPMPAKPEQYAGANSLWKKGSSGFSKTSGPPKWAILSRLTSRLPTMRR